jgi:hypothetical protein
MGMTTPKGAGFYVYLNVTSTQSMVRDKGLGGHDHPWNQFVWG